MAERKARVKALWSQKQQEWAMVEMVSEEYERTAPINFAESLKGKLLIMTGSGETNTHIQIIEGLVDRLIALGKPFDYMVFLGIVQIARIAN